MVKKPNRNFKLKNSSINEIPVTMSAFSMGILVIPMIIVRLVFFMLLMEMQATVPMTVAIKADKSAMISVFHNAERMASFRNREAYHFNVNPPHFALVLLALKDKTIKVPMGAYRKIKIRAI